MLYAQRVPGKKALPTAAVGSLLIFVSCVDGFLKNTHGNTIFYILKDVALVGLLIALLISLSVRPWERPKGKWQGFAVWLLYIGYMSAQVLNPGGGDIMGNIAGFRALVLFSLLFIVGAVFFNSPRRVTKTISVAIGCIMIPAVVGLFQTIAPTAWTSLSPSLLVLSQKFTSYQTGDLGGLAVGFMRAYGTLVDPASLGLATCVGFILAAGALARAKGGARFWYFVCLVTMAVALQLSGSRASAAALGAGLLVFLVLSWRHKSMRLPATISLCVLILAIPLALKAGGGLLSTRYGSDNIDYSAATRTRSEHIVLATLPRHPLGMGLGSTGAGGRLSKGGGAAPLLVDNLYYATLYQTGVPGLLILLVLQGSFLVFAIRGVRTAKTVETRAAYISFAAMQVALLTSGIWTQGSFEYAPVAQIFWLLSGIIALPRRVEGEMS